MLCTARYSKNQSFLLVSLWRLTVACRNSLRTLCSPAIDRFASPTVGGTSPAIMSQTCRALQKHPLYKCASTSDSQSTRIHFHSIMSRIMSSVHVKEKGKEPKGVCSHENSVVLSLLSSLTSYCQSHLTQPAMTLLQRCGFSLFHKLTSLMPLLLRDGRLTWTESSFMCVQTYG